MPVHCAETAVAPGTEALEDRAVEEVRPDGILRREAEEDDEDRRHERAAADAGQADDQADDEARDDELPGHERRPRSVSRASYPVCCSLDIERRHVEVNLGLLGILVRRVDAGEVEHARRARLRVEAGRVALGRELRRQVDEDLDELALVEERARRLAVGAERGDEGGEHDQPGVGHQVSHLARAAVVLGAIGVAEAEILREAASQVRAVEQEGVAARCKEPRLERVRDRRLAGAGPSGEPDDERALRLEPGARVAIDHELLQADVLAARQSAHEQARADGVVRDPVDEDEAAGVAVVDVRVERDRLSRARRGRRRSRSDRAASRRSARACRPRACS